MRIKLRTLPNFHVLRLNYTIVLDLMGVSDFFEISPYLEISLPANAVAISANSSQLTAPAKCHFTVKDQELATHAHTQCTVALCATSGFVH